jgi:hypothetical protein
MTAILPLLWRFRWLLGGLAVAGLIWWQRHEIASQRAALADLRASVAAEKRAREADVAALTTLSRGLVAASSAKTKDQEALSHAIDTQNVQPVSPGLRVFLECLRASEVGRECAAAGTRPATPAPAGNPR